MISSRGKPLTSEVKKLIVSVKQYFDRTKLTPAEPSVKRVANALGIGVATVKRIMADYNRDPNLLDEPTKMRGVLFMQLVFLIKRRCALTFDLRIIMASILPLQIFKFF